ncbi:hypothetical protein FE633_39480 [Streptomyces montanus]|uniref:DUF4232 domain-containing protein n=1 Tax=Streptomyces montanus TaxID=2580423 RepID=A0A5R9FF61_9ACTN|nr:hypothetical protein [Streptomyces montanus]TLS40836.1 hypothetical protein FE633_39480 [Streptomyces montanus]
MGSLRNPVGPLPSSIYWRRRAVLLSLVALLTLLITWIVATGGGGGNNNADGSNGKNPAPSITPGPSGSGPAISQAPGGRDESTSGGGGGDGSGDSGGGSEGSDGADGSSGGSDSAGGGSGDAEGGAGSGDTVPAGSSLPNCAPGSVALTLRSVQNAYAPGEEPKLELIVKNSSSSDCKLDLGPKKAVLTITQAGSDDEIWSSADCPTGAGSILYRIPANDRITRTVEWDREASAPECATPRAGTATAGTYLVEAQAPGLEKTQASFVLKKD